jgi:TetR/AcrR family transcriptional regulator
MTNKEKIMETAIELFSNKGYESVGVQEIVEKSGVTKPTMYHYFGSKLGLFQEILKTKSNVFLSDLKKNTEYKGDLPLTLNNIAKLYFKFAKENKTYYRMLLGMSFGPPESEASKEVLKLFKQQFDLVNAMFASCVKDHGNMKGRNQAYAITFIGMINNYISLLFYDHVELNDELLYKAVKQFMHGIFS